MSIRFNKISSSNIQDHNFLLNRGRRTHEEIDSYLDEIDRARGSFSDLSERLNYLESHSGNGGSNIGNGSGYLYEVFINTIQGNKIVNLNGSYVVGLNELEVFRNGLKQILNDDYFETDSNTITFNFPLDENDVIVLRIRDRLGISSNLGFNSEYIILNEDTDTINTVNNFALDGHNLEVYVNGILQNKDDDFIIVDANTLLFNNLLKTGFLIYVQISDKTLNEQYRLIQEKITLDKFTKFYTLKTFTYQVGKNELELWLNGVRLINGIDYEEVTSNSFQLKEYPPEGGIILACRENGVFAAGSSGGGEYVFNPLSEFKGMYFIYDVPAGVETDIINLPHTYTLGNNELLVFYNGLVVSFTEVDESTIKLPVTVVEGDQVVVYKPNQYVVKLDKLVSSKLSNIEVPSGVSIIEIPIASPAIDISYIGFFSSLNIDCLFEVIESPTNVFALLSLDCKDSNKITTNERTPYVNELNQNKVFVRITNRSSSIAIISINMKYILYSV